MERLEIERDEVPVLNVLNLICHNDVMRADGYPGARLAPIRWYQRICAPIIDIGVHRLRSGEDDART